MVINRMVKIVLLQKILYDTKNAFMIAQYFYRYHLHHYRWVHVTSLGKNELVLLVNL
jgi:hypothetical protein